MKTLLIVNLTDEDVTLESGAVIPQSEKYFCPYCAKREHITERDTIIHQITANTKKHDRYDTIDFEHELTYDSIILPKLPTNTIAIVSEDLATRIQQKNFVYISKRDADGRVLQFRTVTNKKLQVVR